MIEMHHVWGGYVFKFGNDLAIYATYDSKNHKWHFCEAEDEWNYWHDADGSNLLLSISEKKGDAIVNFLKILSTRSASKKSSNAAADEETFDCQGDDHDEEILDCREGEEIFENLPGSKNEEIIGEVQS